MSRELIIGVSDLKVGCIPGYNNTHLEIAEGNDYQGIQFEVAPWCPVFAQMRKTRETVEMLMRIVTLKSGEKYAGFSPESHCSIAECACGLLTRWGITLPQMQCPASLAGSYRVGDRLPEKAKSNLTLIGVGDLTMHFIRLTTLVTARMLALSEADPLRRFRPPFVSVNEVLGVGPGEIRAHV